MALLDDRENSAFCRQDPGSRYAESHTRQDGMLPKAAAFPHLVCYSDLLGKGKSAEHQPQVVYAYI